MTALIPGNLRTTAMAILPHDDVEAALQLALSLDIPFWPQLPHVSYYEDMYVQAMEYFPFSAYTSGAIYFKGPFTLGPAHPFIFNPNLGTNFSSSFYSTYAGGGEEGASKKLEKMWRKEPLFFNNLLWVQPFGVEKIKKLLSEFLGNWQKGTKILSGMINFYNYFFH